MTIPGHLPDHGIIFRRDKKGRSVVSCQCRASETKHSRIKGGGEYYEPMPQRPDESVWDTYNNPDNHWIPFSPTNWSIK